VKYVYKRKGGGLDGLQNYLKIEFALSIFFPFNSTVYDL
jgi:hypothetical protein